MSFLKDLYAAMPGPVQDVMITVYGYKLYRREYGSKLQRKLQQLEKLERAPVEEVGAHQDREFRALIEHSYRNVPYYRAVMDERRLTPDDIRTRADLPRLPILTKEIIKDRGADLVARNYRKSSLIMGCTSGTTGSPVKFYYDAPSCLVKNAVDWRQKRWAGIEPGDPIAFFLGHPIVSLDRRKPPFWRKNRILNHLFCSSFHLSPENMEHYIRALQDFRPLAVEGYPSTLSIVARQLLERNVTLPMRAAFTSSETLYDHQREAIEEAFACRLFDFYGAAERVAFATECEKHEGKHLNQDFGISEILDGNGEPVPAGEMGHLVATGLHNFAMPLIRYRTDDVTAIRTEPCSCGRNFPRMADVTTKAEDIITAPDGRYISSSTLTHPFKPLDSVRESQIIQEDLHHITVKIVARSVFQESERTQLVAELQKRVGGEIRISVEVVDSIPRTNSGKFRWVISKVPLGF